MENAENIKYKNALEKVGALKDFYTHLVFYFIVNVVLFIVRGDILHFFQSEARDKNFIDWIDWNILIVPIFWGIVLLYHASKVFQYKFKFIKYWEERQLKKFIDNE